MLYACRRCGKVGSDRYCPEHRPQSPSSRRNRLPEVQATRRRLIKRAGGRCERCGRRAERLELHHVTPAHKGGTERGALMLCPKCHRELDSYASGAGQNRARRASKLAPPGLRGRGA